MIICHCHAITDNDIKQLIVLGAKTLKDIQEKTGACTSCKGCEKSIKHLLLGRE